MYLLIALVHLSSLLRCTRLVTIVLIEKEKENGGHISESTDA